MASVPTIERAANARLGIAPATGFRSMAGRGVEATVDGVVYSVGGPALLRERKLAVPGSMVSTIDKWKKRGSSVLYLSDGDAVEGFVATVSNDTVWIYHGTQMIPRGLFESREGVRAFLTNILDKTEMISFEPQQFVVEENVVVVIGREHQKVKRSGRELRQEWVQIYTVEDGLIHEWRSLPRPKKSRDRSNPSFDGRLVDAGVGPWQ